MAIYSIKINLNKFHFNFRFLILTRVSVAVASAEVDMSLRWGSLSNSFSSWAGQSPKTIQVSPGFYMNTYYLTLKGEHWRSKEA